MVEPTEQADQVEITALPLMPLASGVALPHMVLTIAAETPEARAAAAAADRGGSRPPLGPRTADGRYARYGTIAVIEDRGKLPNGTQALVVRALERASVGQGIVGDTAALWVQAEPVDEQPLPPEQARELATELRAAL